jgi:hypothetical protein
MCDMEAVRREWEGAKGRSNKDEEGNDCDNDDRPRPRPVGGEEALWTGGLPFGFPAPPLLCLTCCWIAAVSVVVLKGALIDGAGVGTGDALGPCSWSLKEG